jgi:hypothetical protein
MLFGLEPQNAMELMLWISRLWPIALPLLFLLILKVKRPSFFAFLVLGSLVCFGVQSLVSIVSISLPAAFASDASFTDKIFQVALAHLQRSIVASILLSLAPLWWLHRRLSATPNPAFKRDALTRAP